MNWIAEIFSAKSDQARLVTVLISVIVAILVVLLNQWFVSRRSKKELLVEKVEALFLISHEYTSLCWSLLYSSSDKSSGDSNIYAGAPLELGSKHQDTVTKMQMICGLYFSEEEFNPDEYHLRNMPLIHIVHSPKKDPDADFEKAYEDSKRHIKDSRDKLDALCKKLMKKHGH